MDPCRTGKPSKLPQTRIVSVYSMLIRVVKNGVVDGDLAVAISDIEACEVFPLPDDFGVQGFSCTDAVF
jgi:hypothetical protein